jgi:hypothetical protein
MTVGMQTDAAASEGLAPPAWLAAHPGAPEPVRMAVELLDALERRALPEIEARLGAGFTMVFPGPARYTEFGAMAEAAKTRYQRIGKFVEDAETLRREGVDVVYVRGTLHGVNVHGVPFDGVRFVDRFEIHGGRFARQDVWNDLAESGVLQRRA